MERIRDYGSTGQKGDVAVANANGDVTQHGLCSEILSGIWNPSAKESTLVFKYYAGFERVT